MYVYFLKNSLLINPTDPAMQPVEEGALPEDAVLRLEHPVVLVREDQQLRRHTAHLRRVKRCHALVSQDPVVFLTVNAENRRIPLVHELVRRVGKRALGDFVVPIPVTASHVPVGEPLLLGLQVLHLHVEDAVVRNECLEAPVMMSGKPIDTESAKRRTDAAKTVFVHIRQVSARLVNSREVIFHTLSAVVTADLLVPRHAESRQTATVRGNDHIDSPDSADHLRSTAASGISCSHQSAAVG